MPTAAYLRSYISRVMDRGFYSLAVGYDLKLRVLHFFLVEEVNISKITSKSQKLADVTQKLRDFANLHGKYAYKQPLFDGAWADYCILRGWNRWDELGANEAISFSHETRIATHINVDAFSTLESHGLTGKPFITIHAGGDKSAYRSSHGTKIWPLERWGQFCRLFKSRYPYIAVVQIGVDSHTPIEGADLLLCGKTSLAESMAVLKQALLHVDGESGLVHLRRQLGGKSVVLFGPTPEKYFAYAGNINIISPFCTNCMWKTNDWQLNCPRGFAHPECMLAITPESVMEAVGDALAGQREYQYAAVHQDLYSSAGYARRRPILDDILAACSMEKKPISEHIVGPGQTYIHASKQWEYPYAIEHINTMGTGPLRVADVGGGRGALPWYLAQKGHAVTVYDINYFWDHEGNIDVENQFFHFAKTHGFKADFGSVFNIPADDNSFDVVTCISVIEHVLWKEYAIKEMLRVLKPGGRLILTYDLVQSDASTQDAFRAEIFTPRTIGNTLKKIGIADEGLYPVHDVIASLKDIKTDNVNIASDMTVGGLVITKKYD